MSSTTSNTRATALAHVQALIAGTQKHLSNGQFTLGSVAYTTTTLLQVLKGLADALSALAAARVSVKDAELALQQEAAKVDPVIRDFHRYLLAAFSNAAQALADFGIEPPKARKPLTAEQLAARAAKARATRKARGTTSKKQKLAVKGDVTGVTITPVTSAPASPSPQPVSTASSTPSPTPGAGASK